LGEIEPQLLEDEFVIAAVEVDDRSTGRRSNRRTLYGFLLDPYRYKQYKLAFITKNDPSIVLQSGNDNQIGGSAYC
jgi:hypothetical protein